MGGAKQAPMTPTEGFVKGRPTRRSRLPEGHAAAQDKPKCLLLIVSVEKPFISVIITAYNRKEFLLQAVSSAPRDVLVLEPGEGHVRREGVLAVKFIYYDRSLGTHE